MRPTFRDEPGERPERRAAEALKPKPDARPKSIRNTLWSLKVFIYFLGFLMVVSLLARSDCDPSHLTALGGSGSNCFFYSLFAAVFAVPTLACAIAFWIIRRRWPK
jgi:hypothetical protein